MSIVYLIGLGVVPFLFGGRAKRRSAIGVVSLLTLFYGLLAVCSLFEISPLGRYGVEMTPLGAIFSLLFCSTVLPSLMVHRAPRAKSMLQSSIFYSSAIVLFVSIQGVLLTLNAVNTTVDNVYEFAVNWELMSLSSFTLMLFESAKRKYFHSAVIYFIVMHVAFFVMLGGLISIGGGDGGNILGVGAMELWVWLLLFVGFALKSAIFPLHFWMPHSYEASLGAGAGIMAGSATNIGLYGIFVITYSSADVYTSSYIMMTLGLISALYGAVSMMQSSSLSRVLVYSSMENIGVVLFAFGLSFYAKEVGANSVALLSAVGGTVKLFAHGVAKSLMLTIGGNIRRRAKTEAISEINHQSAVDSTWTVGFGIGGLSLSSMPVFGSFVGKLLLFCALFIGVANVDLSIISVVGIVVVCLCTASSVFTMTKSFMVGFIRGGGKAEELHREKEEDGALSSSERIGIWVFVSLLCFGGWVIAYVLVEVCNRVFVIGVRDTLWVRALLDNLLVMCIVLVSICGGLYLLRRAVARRNGSRSGSAWQCGYSGKKRDVVESVESFSYEVNKALVSFHKEQKESGVGSRVDGGQLRRRVSPMRLLRKWTHRLALLQTGRTSSYIMHIVWFLALVLILSLVGVL